MARLWGSTASGSARGTPAIPVFQIAPNALTNRSTSSMPWSNSSTRWPRDSSSLAVASTASMQAWATSISTGGVTTMPDPELGRGAGGQGRERLGRRERVVPGQRIGPADDVEHGRGVGDRPAHDAAGGQALEAVRAARHPVAARLEPDQAAARRRDADRPAAVARVRDRGHARGDGGGRATARPARGVVGVPRVPGDAQRVALGEGHRAELGRRRLVEQDEPGLLEALDDQLALGDRLLRRPLRAVAGRPAGHVVQVLDRDGHAVERRRARRPASRPPRRWPGGPPRAPGRRPGSRRR